MNTRTIALIGEKKFKKIQKARIAVFGVGGVGGIAAESLIRSGVRNIYIIDSDKVSVSNLNRQILFNNNDIGKNKVDAAKTHLKNISPKINIVTFNLFFDSTNINQFPFDKFDYVIDAIDSSRSKITLIKHLMKLNVPFISSLGMGNRLDLTKLVITTLDKTHDDPLAKKLRNELKKDKINLKKIRVVASNEIPIKNKNVITSMMFVPSLAGLLLSNYVIQEIIKSV